MPRRHYSLTHPSRTGPLFLAGAALVGFLALSGCSGTKNPPSSTATSGAVAAAVDLSNTSSDKADATVCLDADISLLNYQQHDLNAVSGDSTGLVKDIGSDKGPLAASFKSDETYYASVAGTKTISLNSATGPYLNQLLGVCTSHGYQITDSNRTLPSVPYLAQTSSQNQYDILICDDAKNAQADLTKGVSDESSGNSSAVTQDVATLKTDGTQMGRDITADKDKLAGQFSQVFQTYIQNTNPATEQQALNDAQQLLTHVTAICNANGFNNGKG